MYTIEVEGRRYVARVSEGGDVDHVHEVTANTPSVPVKTIAPAITQPVNAPLSGAIWKVVVKAGQVVKEGDILVILEAMKMETEVRAAHAGTVDTILVKEGDAVAVGDGLLTLK